MAVVPMKKVLICGLKKDRKGTLELLQRQGDVYKRQVICTAAILAPVIAPYDPDAIAGPFGAPPGPGFLLGTDQIGRDMFSRLLYATRISLLVGVLATAISTAIGVSLGLLGGYFGGWLDIAIMRFTDMVMRCV